MDDILCPPRALPDQSLPWLIFSHSNGKSKKVQTFSTAPFNNKSYLMSVPEMRGKLIKASLLGWLLLREHSEDRDNYAFTLWNPFTLKSIHLPPLIFHDEGPFFMRCALTSAPCDDDCCFIFLFFQGCAFSCQIQPKGRDIPSSGWVCRRVEIEGAPAAITHVVTLNKILYCSALAIINQSHFRCMVCIEVATDGSNSFTSRPLPFITIPKPLFPLLQWTPFMVESCGSIYVAQLGTRHYEGVHVVKVWELDLQKGIWTGVKSLGDRAFLLARDGCTWCWATKASDSTGTVKGDCVYFYEVQFVKEKVLCYNLKDFSCTFLPCPKLLNPRSPWPVWVAPQHIRFSGRQQWEKHIDKNNDSMQSSEAANTTECILAPQRDGTQENWYKLPLHIIELMSTYMHLFDYCNFRCTCKIIKEATSIPQWRTNNSLPLFMIFEDDSGLCRLMDPCRDDSHSCVLQISQDLFDIEYTRNGWLLIRDEKSLQLFNPFKKERVYLPLPTRRYFTIGFSSYPACSKFLIVTINSSNDRIIFTYLRFGDKEWSSCHFGNNQGSPFKPGFGSPTYFSGGFYFLDGHTGKLGVFEIVDDGEPQWTVYDRPFVRFGEFHSCYLVECSTELISVFIGINGSWIQLFKFNNTKKKWVGVKDLGNHILFISHVSCFSEVTRDRNLRNRIYIPALKGKRIVFYSLETEKYHVDDGLEDTSKNFLFMKQPFKCCWI